MGPNLVGYQQPVSERTPRRILALAGIFAVLAVAALVVSASVRNADTPQGADETAATSEETSSLQTEAERLLQSFGRAAQGLPEGMQASSSQTFLSDLDAAQARVLADAPPTDESQIASCAVMYRDKRTLAGACRNLLKTYEDHAGYSVATSGYLDIKGNAWGAALTKQDELVDVVMVTCNDEDSEATVRVVRLVPERR